MRKKNSIAEFASQRNELLLKNFRESIARQSVISAARAFHEAANAPAPRFWVSEARATKVITALLKGIDITDGMNPEKKEMYLEILQRVREVRERNPEISIGDAVFGIVNGPAPKSYLSLSRAAHIIYKTKSRK